MDNIVSECENDNIFALILQYYSVSIVENEFERVRTDAEKVKFVGILKGKTRGCQ